MFHINPETGEPGSCRARKHCPFGEPAQHYASKDEARKAYEATQEMALAFSSVIPKKSMVTDAALASKLSYGGPIPKWFTETPTRLQENLFSCKPELIDVIEGPTGPLAVVWEDNSIDANDVYISAERGYNTSKLAYRDLTTGELKGYLKTAYMDEESVRRSYGDDGWEGFRFMAEMESFYGMEKDYPDARDFSPADETLELTSISAPALETREQLLKFVKLARQEFWEPEREKLENLSDEELRSEVDSFKQLARKRLAKSLESYRIPYIDYSKISDPALRGKGAGHGLYIYTARMLAKKGLPLRGSGLQTPEAAKSWRLMAADSRLPVSIHHSLFEIHGSRSTQVNYLLDFRATD